MPYVKVIVMLIAVLVGIPNQMIDYRHRKNRDYEPGNAWEYYARLRREGSWEGKFMMWTGYGGIIVIVSALSFLAWRLFTS